MSTSAAEHDGARRVLVVPHVHRSGARDAAATTARLLIVGQAPGTKVHETGIPWNDPSGERLRDWLQVDREIFYDESRIAIMPMGFCYPGVDRNGGDKPPRPFDPAGASPAGTGSAAAIGSDLD